MLLLLIWGCIHNAAAHNRVTVLRMNVLISVQRTREGVGKDELLIYEVLVFNVWPGVNNVPPLPEKNEMIIRVFYLKSINKSITNAELIHYVKENWIFLLEHPLWLRNASDCHHQPSASNSLMSFSITQSGLIQHSFVRRFCSFIFTASLKIKSPPLFLQAVSVQVERCWNIPVGRRWGASNKVAPRASRRGPRIALLLIHIGITGGIAANCSYLHSGSAI